MIPIPPPKALACSFCIQQGQKWLPCTKGRPSVSFKRKRKWQRQNQVTRLIWPGPRRARAARTSGHAPGANERKRPCASEIARRLRIDHPHSMLGGTNRYSRGKPQVLVFVFIHQSAILGTISSQSLVALQRACQKSCQLT